MPKKKSPAELKAARIQTLERYLHDVAMKKRHATKAEVDKAIASIKKLENEG